MFLIKYRWIVGLALLDVLTAGAFADAPDWENEQVLHINTEPPRATFIPFATVEQALNENSTNSPFYFSLNGDMEIQLGRKSWRTSDKFF